MYCWMQHLTGATAFQWSTQLPTFWLGSQPASTCSPGQCSSPSEEALANQLKVSFYLDFQEVPCGCCMICWSCKSCHQNPNLRINQFSASAGVCVLPRSRCLCPRCCVSAQLSDVFLFFLAAGISHLSFAALLLTLPLALCSCRRC